MNIGHKRWIIADGYIPGGSTGDSREFISHDALCILNCGSEDAHIEITLYFSDRDPLGPYCFIVNAARTRHSVSSLFEAEYIRLSVKPMHFAAFRLSKNYAIGLKLFSQAVGNFEAENTTLLEEESLGY